jgi:hypothetical protein
MSFLKQDQVENVAVRRGNDEGEQHDHKKASLKSENTDCGCHALRYCRGGDLRTVLVRPASFHPFSHGAYRRSSVPLAVNISVPVESGAEAAFPKSASVTRPRREDDPMAHYPPLPLASLATLRVGRISDARRNGIRAAVEMTRRQNHELQA